MTVLVTGFGPFDGGSNASERLVEALETRRTALAGVLRRPLALAVLPVDTVAAPRALEELIASHRPAHLLLTGQAAGRSAVSLEQRAVNRRDFSIPDASGQLLAGVPVAGAGPDSHASSWPDQEGAAEEMRAAGIPAALSRDCGTYLCNQLLYAALHHAAERRLPLRAMFLHVPLTPQQVAAGEPAALRHPECPSLSVAATVQAVEILLARLARAHAADKVTVSA